MRLLCIGIIAALSVPVLACGPSATAEERGNCMAKSAKFDSAKFAFLSDAAKANGLRLKDKMKAMWKEKLSICGLSPVMTPELRAQIKAIRKNDGLDRQSKRSQIKAILEPLRPAKEALREAMKKCKQEKAEQIQPLKDTRMALKSACLLEKFDQKKDGEEGGMKGHKKRMWAILKGLNEQEKTELNAKLESAECAAALAK